MDKKASRIGIPQPSLRFLFAAMIRHSEEVHPSMPVVGLPGCEPGTSRPGYLGLSVVGSGIQPGGP